jgi:hypothetical protein
MTDNESGCCDCANMDYGNCFDCLNTGHTHAADDPCSQKLNLYSHECEEEYTSDADGREYLLPCTHPEHEGEQ